MSRLVALRILLGFRRIAARWVPYFFALMANGAHKAASQCRDIYVIFVIHFVAEIRCRCSVHFISLIVMSGFTNNSS
jgi:hypothetical protein